MKRSKFLEEQMVYPIQQAEANTQVGPLPTTWSEYATSDACKIKYSNWSSVNCGDSTDSRKEKVDPSEFLLPFPRQNHSVGGLIKKWPARRKELTPRFQEALKPVASGPVGSPSLAAPPVMDEVARRICVRCSYAFAFNHV